MDIEPSVKPGMVTEERTTCGVVVSRRTLVVVIATPCVGMVAVTVEPLVVAKGAVPTLLPFERLPLTKTTRTATYAAVAAKTSCRRAFFNNARDKSNLAVKQHSAPIFSYGLVMKYSANTAPIKSTPERTVEMMLTASLTVEW